jgi:hypothetical protein
MLSVLDDINVRVLFSMAVNKHLSQRIWLQSRWTRIEPELSENVPLLLWTVLLFLVRSIPLIWPHTVSLSPSFPFRILYVYKRHLWSRHTRLLIYESMCHASCDVFRHSKCHFSYWWYYYLIIFKYLIVTYMLGYICVFYTCADSVIGSCSCWVSTLK